MNKLLTILLFLICISNLNAFDELELHTSDKDIQDTLETSIIEETNDSLESNNYKIQADMTKSPYTALYLSVVPGLGQYYNESYIKSGILFGASLTLAAIIYDRQVNFEKWQDKVIEYKRNNELEDGETDATLEKYTEVREFYRDDRDLWGFYLLGVYTISAIDAYVGANLFDFEVTEEISMNLRPDFKNIGLSVNFTW